jgi:hypothetical protein
MQEEKKMDNVEEQQVESQTATETTSQDDIFAQVFGEDKTDQFVARTEPVPMINEQGEQNEVLETSDPKNDTNSYQYWQSQADKRSAEVDLLKSQVTELMKSKQPTAEEPVAKETVTIEKPVKPRKPAGYDHSEALADPDSDSGKFLSKQEQYIDNLANYMTDLDAKRSNQLEKQVAEQQQFQRNQKVISDLQSRYEYTPQQANDFIDKMSRPDSLSLENLVRLHKMSMQNNEVTQIKQVTQEARQKQALMTQRQQKLSIPTPIGVQPGANVQSSKNVEDQMMDSMITNHRKKNPFN